MRLKVAILGLAVGAMLLALPAVMEAQRPKGARVVHKPAKRHVVRSRHLVHRKVVAKPPAGHAKVVVRGRPYVYHHGVFYRHGSSGYVVIRGPVGARVRVLPPRFRTVVVGPTTYYHYYGTYYEYDSDAKEYVVVDTPVEEQEGDVLTLVEGETLAGRFVGASEAAIEFEVDGEIQEIPIEEVVSISFEPPPVEEEEGE